MAIEAFLLGGRYTPSVATRSDRRRRARVRTLLIDIFVGALGWKRFENCN